MIRVGEVAFLKTTGEPVFVLDIIKDGEGYHPTAPKLGGQLAMVRYAMVAKDAINHTIKYFYVEELESFDEVQEKRLARQGNVENLFKEPEGDGMPDIMNSGMVN